MLHRVAAIILLLASGAFADTLPQKLNFQGKLLDPSTNNPKNGTVDFTFRVCSHPTNACTSCPGAVCLWEETQSNVPVNNGVFAVQLGAVTALNPEVFLNGASTYLSVTASPDASEMTPRQQLVMSPYAYTAAQLLREGDVRVNAGIAYSTFTSGGNLLVQHGVSAATAAFTGAGPSVFSLTTSSGIQLNGGTLKVDGSGGVDARYGVAAATGSFTATGTATYSLSTSSGVQVQNGTVDLQGSGGLKVANRVYLGYNIQTNAGNNTILRVACAGADETVLGGGCRTAAGVNVRLNSSFPCTETTDSVGTEGTAVTDGATLAKCWSCVWVTANAANNAFVICGRLGN